MKLQYHSLTRKLFSLCKTFHERIQHKNYPRCRLNSPNNKAPSHLLNTYPTAHFLTKTFHYFQLQAQSGPYSQTTLITPFLQANTNITLSISYLTSTYFLHNSSCSMTITLLPPYFMEHRGQIGSVSRLRMKA